MPLPSGVTCGSGDGHTGPVASTVRRFAAPALVSIVVLALAYISVIMWLVWSAGSFDMSGFDTGVWKQGHEVALWWPIVTSALTLVSLLGAVTLWKRSAARS